METPKKPAKKTSASKAPAKKTTDKSAAAAKPKSRFVDDDDDEFDNSLDDDLGGYDNFDALEEEEDY